MSQAITLHVNGHPRPVLVDAHDMLVDVLRDRLRLTGT